MTDTSKSSALKFMNLIWMQISSQSFISGVSQLLLTKKSDIIIMCHIPYIHYNTKVTYASVMKVNILNIIQDINMFKTKIQWFINIYLIYVLRAYFDYVII